MFGESGVADATLDDIARRAGVSKGTIYLYFPNKEALFRQTIRHALAAAAAAGAASPTGSAARQLQNSVARHWEFLTCEPVPTATRLLSAEQWQFPDLAELYAAEVVTPFTDEVTNILELGMRAGEFRELDPTVAAAMLAALTAQNASWRASGGGPSSAANSSEVVLRQLTEFYLQAVTPLNSAFPQADGA